MTVNVEIPKIKYIGNGAVASFSFNFKTYDPADIEVYEDGVLSIATITVTLNTDQNLNPGGAATYATPPINGLRILIKRVLPLDQPADFDAYSGFPTTVNERALDRSVQVAQQESEEASRTVIASVEDDGTTDLTFPDYQADKGIAWDPFVKRLVNTVNNVDQTAADAAAAAVSAADSQNSANASNNSAFNAATSESNANISSGEALNSENAALQSRNASAVSETNAANSAAQAGAAAGIIVFYPFTTGDNQDFFATLGAGALVDGTTYNIRLHADSFPLSNPTMTLNIDGNGAFPVVRITPAVDVRPFELRKEVVYGFTWIAANNVFVVSGANYESTIRYTKGNSQVIPSGVPTKILFNSPPDTYWNGAEFFGQRGIKQISFAAQVKMEHNPNGTRFIDLRSNTIQPGLPIVEIVPSPNVLTTSMGLISGRVISSEPYLFWIEVYQDSGVSLQITGDETENWFSMDLKV